MSFSSVPQFIDMVVNSTKTLERNKERYSTSSLFKDFDKTGECNQKSTKKSNDVDERITFINQDKIYAFFEVLQAIVSGSLVIYTEEIFQEGNCSTWFEYLLYRGCKYHKERNSLER